MWGRDAHLVKGGALACPRPTGGGRVAMSSVVQRRAFRLARPDRPPQGFGGDAVSGVFDRFGRTSRWDTPRDDANREST